MPSSILSPALPASLALGAFILALGAPTGAVAEPLPGSDIAALDPGEIRIVQDLLYEKAGSVEASLALGFIPNDPYVLSGSLGLGATYHLSETLAVEGTFNFFGNRETAEGERLGVYGVAVDGYSPFLQGGIGATWTPIYAKLNLLGRAILHYDLYLAGGAGAFLAERTLLAGVDNASESGLERFNSPFSVNVGLGQRFFLRPDTRTQSVKVEVRDHLYRATTPEGEGWIKHNVHITAGWGVFF